MKTFTFIMVIFFLYYLEMQECQKVIDWERCNEQFTDKSDSITQCFGIKNNISDVGPNKNNKSEACIMNQDCDIVAIVQMNIRKNNPENLLDIYVHKQVANNDSYEITFMITLPSI